ncbi:MAG: type II toxin-antitoxin system RelE/ParE family toxin [Planctomycetia bacterium]|nr:type II toxin-antitoxin system RelE/ParE family toxin [Planctomycetia bacterium]
MAEIPFHRLAAKELLAAAAWYAQRSEQARQRFRLAIAGAIDRILSNPESHAVIADSYRHARVRRFPYVLIFEIRSDRTIQIVAVAHTSRRPGFWRRRV